MGDSTVSPLASTNDPDNSSKTFEGKKSRLGAQEADMMPVYLRQELKTTLFSSSVQRRLHALSRVIRRAMIQTKWSYLLQDPDRSRCIRKFPNEQRNNS